MAHEIFGDRFIGAREPAWHKLGTVFHEPITASEAIAKANMDYRVEKFPLVGVRETVDSGGNATMEPMGTPKFGLWREPTDDAPEYHFLGGVVAEGFEIIQNYELAQLVDPFTEEWPVETAASMRDGAITLITLDIGQFEVAGEKYKHFMSVNNGHDGTRSFNLHVTGTREVCMNTLEYGESNAVFNVTLRHSENVKTEAQWYVEQIMTIRSALKRHQELMQRMAEVKLKTADVKGYVESVFPLPKKSQRERFIESAKDVVTEDVYAKLDANDTSGRTERAVEWVELLRDASMERYVNIEPNIAGTLMGAYQAVNEVTNWRRGSNADESLVLRGGQRNGELVKAWDKAVALVPA